MKFLQKSEFYNVRFPWAIIAILLASLLCLWALRNLINYAKVTPVSFDGALNLLVSQSIVNGHRYGLFYDSFFAFPAQTDGPFILPASLAFLVLGVTAFSTQLVSLAYIVFFAVSVIMLLKQCSVPTWFAMAGALLCAQTPGFVSFGMNAYGEIPVLAWFFTSLIIIAFSLSTSTPRTGFVAIGGVTLAIAYLTKVVALVCVAPALLISVLYLLTRHHSLRCIFLLAFGFILPIVAWESFRLSQFGSLQSYLNWWTLQLGQVQAQSGAGALHPKSYLFEKGLLHLGILSQAVGVPRFLLLSSLFLLPLLSFITLISCKFKHPQRFIIICITTVFLIFFIWWLLISPTSMAWLRRIMDGFIIGQCITLIIVVALAKLVVAEMGPGSRSRLSIMALSLGLIPVFIADAFLLSNGELFPTLKAAGFEEQAQLPLVKALKALPPEAKIFGVGWWQSPVLALVSSRTIFNFQRWLPSQINAVPQKYFLTDYYAQGLAQPAINDILGSLSYKPIVQSIAGSLYKIDHADPYPPFLPSERIALDLARKVDFANGTYRHMRGIYDPDGAWAWSRPESAFILRREKEEHLTAEVEAFPGTVDSFGKANKSPQLRMVVEGCADQIVPLIDGIKQTINIDLKCSSSADLQPVIVKFLFNGTVKPVHQLDADTRSLGFMLFNVGLAY